jgi:ATP-binding cassette subfamily B multidrug efflux pump
MRGWRCRAPAFFQQQRTGNLMALATNDIDAVEMAAGEGMLAGFDGTLTLVLVVATMSLGVDWRLAAFALLPFPLMALSSGWISHHVHEASRASLERFGDAQRPRAGDAGRRAHGARPGPAGAQRGAVPRPGRAAPPRASLAAQRWEAAYEPAVGFTLSAATR